MAQTNIYIKLEIYENSNIINVTDWFLESDLEEVYTNSLQSSKEFGWAEKFEVLEGYALQHIHLTNVKFDGRKRAITDKDICLKLSELGLAIAPVTNKGESPLFGFRYKANDQLKQLLSDNLDKRKQLIGEGKFVVLKEIA